MKKSPDDAGKKKLKKAWQSLAAGNSLYLIKKTTPARPQLIKLKTKKDRSVEHMYELASNPEVAAVVTAAQSWDGFEALEKRARRMDHRSMDEILRGKTYLKYTKAWGKSGIHRKIRSF